MSKRKIHYLLFLFFITASFSETQDVKAHNPSLILINYQDSISLLTLTITHYVSDQSHYINKIVVKLNGITEVSQTYTNQPTPNGGSYSFHFVANDDDRIEVTATCNEGGSKTACIIVGVGVCPTDDAEVPAIPGYFGLWAIFGISIIVGLAMTHRKLRHNSI